MHKLEKNKYWTFLIVEFRETNKGTNDIEGGKQLAFDCKILRYFAVGKEETNSNCIKAVRHFGGGEGAICFIPQNHES